MKVKIMYEENKVIINMLPWILLFEDIGSDFGVGRNENKSKYLYILVFRGTSLSSFLGTS